MRDENLERVVGGTRVFLLDLDGTVYLGEKLIGDMAATLDSIRESGRKIVFCTNNSSKSASAYHDKLRRLGLYRSGDSVYTSGMATVSYLKRTYPGKSVYLVGTEVLRTEFASAGIRLKEEDADLAVLAYDTTLTFEKIVRLNAMLAQGKPYIATHPDNVCPGEGVYPPDVGSFIQLFKTSSGRVPDVICGKPYTVMGDGILAYTGARAEEVTMVGDRLNTDIQFGNNNGFRTLLVFSGETDRGKLREAPPEQIPSVAAESLNDVVPYL